MRARAPARTPRRPVVPLALAIAAALLLPSLGHAEEPAPEAAATPSLLKGDEVAASLSHGFAIGFDAVLLRPIAAIKTGIGLSLFAPAAVLTCVGGRDALKEGWDVLVGDPAKDIYERPLGDL